MCIFPEFSPLKKITPDFNLKHSERDFQVGINTSLVVVYKMHSVLPHIPPLTWDIFHGLENNLG